MATDTDTAIGTNRNGRTARGVARAIGRLLVDLIVATGWVVLLTLLFLETAWPRWAFYAALVAGIGGYVAITAAWRRRRERSA